MKHMLTKRAISTNLQQHYMSLIAFARGTAVPFWSLSSSWQLKACAFLYNWHYRGLICITFAEVAAVLFWSTTSLPLLTLRFSSWYCENAYPPVFLYSGLTFKLFGWLYDPGWLARAHLHPRSFYPFQKTLLPIRLIVSYEYDPWGSLLAFVPHLPLMSSRDARQDPTGFTNVLSRVALKCAPLVPLGAPCHTSAGRPRPYRVPVWPIWGPRVTYR